MFWFLTAVLALVVAAPILTALLRRRHAMRSRADYDIAVYREQLAGVDSDLARGVITPEAAERTRAEIARRILDADRHRSAERAAETPRWASLAAAGFSMIVLVGGSVSLYGVLGAPGYGDLPLQARLSASAEMRANRPSQSDAEAQAAPFRPAAPQPGSDYLDLMERLRATVAERPGDTRGLALLARNEAALGNFEAAHAAQTRLIDALGAAATAGHYAELADMLVLAAGGYVSPEAEDAIGKALARDPRNGTARYYSGLLHAQTGRPDMAVQVWRPLLAESRPDAPWVAPIEAQIEDLAARAGIRYRPPEPATASPGPTARDLAAAEDMDPEARSAMVRGMVEGLAERLAEQGGPPQDWARLIAALGVLGDEDRAAAIWKEARSDFANQPEALATLRAAAEQAGVAD